MLDGSMVRMSDAPNLRPDSGGGDLRGGGGAHRPESAPETAPKMAESAPKRGAPETHARARPLRGGEPSGRPEDRGGPSGPPRLRGGSLEQGVSAPDRAIFLDDLPRPYVTTQASVTQAMGDAAPDPGQALREAEALHRRRALMSDRLLGLRESRRITGAEMRAGSEMRMVVEWQAGAFQPIARSQFRERLASSAYDGDGHLWMALTEIEHTRYLPWLEWAKAVRVGRGADATLVRLVRLVVIDGLGLHQAEEALSLRKDGRVLRLLRSGLHHYAAAAGWQAGVEPPAEVA